MPTDSGQLEHLLRVPGETLNVELKRWIDPATPENEAKIAKAPRTQESQRRLLGGRRG